MAKMQLIRILILAMLPVMASAQKIKYKEVFGLLSTKQYELAEPFLRKYIVENGSKAEASSYLFMGIIYQEKADKGDVLKNTETSIMYADSALYFLDLAYKNINDKEFRGSSKEYYAMYNKRDLRTGEYGAKLSDVQFDIDKRITSLKERKDVVVRTKRYFSQAEDLYKRSHELYMALHKAFAGERELYFRADEGILNKLTFLSVRFDSCAKAFENYKISAGNLGMKGYNQTWKPVEIKNFKQDGVTPADFYSNDLQVWDYKKFADEAILTINNEIKPLQENLVKYDIEINKLREKLKTDSVSVKNDLTKLIDNLLGEKLKKFDPTPMPMNVMAVKVADLEYKSTLIEHEKGGVIHDVFERLQQTELELKALRKLDSLTSRLMTINIDEESINYKHFISNTYNNVVILKTFIKAEKEYADREKRIKETELQNRKSALNWLLVGSDSVPASFEISSDRFTTLAAEKEKYVAGLDAKDSLALTGYFYTITPSRVPDVRVPFQVDKSWAKASELGTIKGIAASDEGEHIYFVLVFQSEAVTGKYKASLAKIYRSDGLSWSHNFSFDFEPEQLEYRQDTGELMIKSTNNTVTIDKSGKMK
ncbi:MAG: hypothetical protein KF845_10365 [Cyclobacteriaceae bacterium]|nr:hypothetical protein [Cyclobacteriaceae bacterium]